MKFILLLCCLFMFSGCGKINDLTSPKNNENTTTDQPIYDNQEEVKLLLPWDWFF